MGKGPSIHGISGNECGQTALCFQVAGTQNHAMQFERTPWPVNKRKYADIYAQQARARDTLTQVQATLRRDPFNTDLVQRESSARQNYVSITQSALSLIKQQSKAEWVGYGDECSRYFTAKIKQRKAMISIYQLKDKQGQWVEGFEAVADIITAFYKDLLGK